MGIEGIGANQPQVRMDQLSDPVAGKIAEEVVKDILPLLGAAGNLSVSEMRKTDKNEGNPDVTGDVPALSDADRELLERVAVDLEALIAKLSADSTKAQVQASKDRIESLQGQLKQQHEESMAKINETLEEMKDQYDSYIAQEVLGWLGVVLAVAMAVVSVLTCGAATAAFAVVGAVIAVGLQVLSETGVTEELTKAIADALKASGLSKEEADAVAQIIVALIELALSLVGIVGGAATAASEAKAVAKGVKTAAKTLVNVTSQVQKGIQIGMAVSGGVMSAAGLSASTASTVINYKASETQAEVTELQAILKRLQTALQEEEDELKQLLQQLSDSMSVITELLVSKQDTLTEISMNIGA